jgi:hypothetical protein
VTPAKPSLNLWNLLSRGRAFIGISEGRTRVSRGRRHFGGALAADALGHILFTTDETLSSGTSRDHWERDVVLPKSPEALFQRIGAEHFILRVLQYGHRVGLSFFARPQEYLVESRVHTVPRDLRIAFRARKMRLLAPPIVSPRVSATSSIDRPETI